jgi:hypothetical protein
MNCNEDALDTKVIDKRVASMLVCGFTTRSPWAGGANGV